MSHILWKKIEKAQLKIIRKALCLHYKKNNKLVNEYVGYVKNLQQPDDLKKYIKSTAIMLFPNEEAYNKKIGKYRKWYQNKKDLLANIKNLYSLFYIISKEE